MHEKCVLYQSVWSLAPLCWPGMSCKTIKDHNSLDPKPYTVVCLFEETVLFLHISSQVEVTFLNGLPTIAGCIWTVKVHDRETEIYGTTNLPNWPSTHGCHGNKTKTQTWTPPSHCFILKSQIFFINWNWTQMYTCKSGRATNTLRTLCLFFSHRAQKHEVNLGYDFCNKLHYPRLVISHFKSQMTSEWSVLKWLWEEQGTILMCEDISSQGYM